MLSVRGVIIEERLGKRGEGRNRVRIERMCFFHIWSHAKVLYSYEEWLDLEET